MIPADVTTILDVDRDDSSRRVLFITYHFPPSLEIGGHTCAQIARHLPRHGWQPLVLTVKTCYIERGYLGPAQHIAAPVARTRVLPNPFLLYAGLKSRLRFRTAENTRTGTSETDSAAARRWVTSLLSVPDTVTGWIPPAVAAGLRMIRRHRVRHLFSSAPPWSSHLVGLVLARVTGLPWTAHFRDPWTQAPPLKPVSALSLWLDALLERRVIRRATSVVCVTDRHTTAIRDAYHELAAQKFVTISNGFDEEEWANAELEGDSTRSSDTSSFVVTYAGSLYGQRSPGTFFRVLRKLADSGQVDLTKLRVEFLGWAGPAGGRPVRDMAAECGLERCVFVHGPVSRPETLRKLRRSNLLLLFAEGWPLQIPGKTYEYLRAGRPILALAGEGEVADLLRKTGGAWVIDPTDQDGIAGAICEAYRSWTRGTVLPGVDRTVSLAFDRRRLAGRFASLFDQTTPT